MTDTERKRLEALDRAAIRGAGSHSSARRKYYEDLAEKAEAEKRAVAAAPAVQSLPDAQGEVALPILGWTALCTKCGKLHEFETEPKNHVCDCYYATFARQHSRFTADQLHSHAAACVLADRQKRGAEVVAVLTDNEIHALIQALGEKHNLPSFIFVDDRITVAFARAIEQRLRVQPALTDEQYHAICESAMTAASQWAGGFEIEPAEEQISGVFVRAILAAVMQARVRQAGAANPAHEGRSREGTTHE